jgi:membrane protease YdiL (CAAX protease family)
MSEMNPFGSLPPATTPPGSEPPGKPPLPDDLKTPWNWGGLLLFLVVAFASLFLLTSLMAGVAMIWFHVKSADLQKFATTSATFLSLRTALWYGVMLLYLAATIRLGYHAPFWRTIGWRKLRPGKFSPLARYVLFALGGMLMAVVVEMASAVLRTKAKLPIEALFHDRQGILWLMAVGILLAPVVEETLFRGYLYPVLARALGVEGGVLVTGLLFGAMHAPQLWGGWGQMALIALVGITLTYVRARSGSVVASWLLHLGYNTFLFGTFFVTTGGLRHLPHGS